MNRTYPDKLEIVPITSQYPYISVSVPGSKSITNRSLVLAALASSQGDCFLNGALRSEDTEVMIEALQRLGFAIEPQWEQLGIKVKRHLGPLIPASEADLFVANSGTTMRFLTAILAAGNGRYRLDGSPRMRERPIGDLLDAMGQLGVSAKSEAGTACPPVVIEANGLAGGRVSIRGDVSSQFLSGLLMAAPFARAPVEINVTGPLVSKPYVEMTIDLMHQWGLHVVQPFEGLYRAQPQAQNSKTGR